MISDFSNQLKAMQNFYSKQQFIEMVKDYLRAFNHPDHVVADGLSDKDCEIIGIIDMAVRERPVEIRFTDLPIYKEQPLFIGS